jgi:hypothetical protein
MSFADADLGCINTQSSKHYGRRFKAAVRTLKEITRLISMLSMTLCRIRA